MLTSDLKVSIVKEWLSEYRSSSTANTVRQRFNVFVEWYNPKAIKEISFKPPKKRTIKKKIEVQPEYNKTIKRLSEIDSKEARSLLLKFQRQKVEQGVKANSIRAYVSATKNFFEEACGFSIKFKRGKLVEAEEAEGYHTFSNGDLYKMFEVATLEYKALIATSVSLGWSIDDVLHLDKKHIQSLIERAKQSNQKFVFYETKRRKTNAKTLAVINPFALEWLDRWIKHNTSENLWTVKSDAVGQMLVKLAERSGITLSGKVRFHKIRAWVINSLIKAGFSQYQWKYVVGKKIPLSDATYLDLKQQVIEKYPKIYTEYMYVGKSSMTIETASLSEQLKRQQMFLQGHKETISKLAKRVYNLKQEAQMRNQSIEDLMKLTSFLKSEIEALKQSKP